jgi:hypothetical protein
MGDTVNGLLRKVHKRIGLGVDMITFSDESGPHQVEIRWRRVYDGVHSDERFATAPNIAGALRAVLNREDEADAEDAADPGAFRAE